MEEIVSVCGYTYCNEIFDTKPGKLYCSRACKVKAKDERISLHARKSAPTSQKIKRKFILNEKEISKRYEKIKLRSRLLI